MNTRRKLFSYYGLAAVAAFVGLTIPLPGQAQKPTKPGVAQKGKPARDFKAAAATWKQVKAKSAALDQTISAKKMKTVHEAAFAVRDQVKMLPAKSKALSADTQAKLAKGVKTVADLASQLDEAGDNGKQSEAEALNKKMHTVLTAIAGLYPAGALK